MASKPLCNLLTQLLNLPEVKVSDYQLHQNIGIILYLESKSQQVPCPRCHNISNRLHQNHWYLVKDLPVSGWATYLKVNRRQFKCETCKKPFSELLDYVALLTLWWKTGLFRAYGLWLMAWKMLFLQGFHQKY